MKSTVLRTFKQIYKHPETKEEKEYSYQVAIVLDTENYKYRILNVTSCSLWKNICFDTIKAANDFLDKHPHSTGAKQEIKLNRLFGEEN